MPRKKPEPDPVEPEAVAEPSIIDFDGERLSSSIQKLLRFSTFSPEQRYWLDTGSEDLNAVFGAFFGAIAGAMAGYWIGYSFGRQVADSDYGRGYVEGMRDMHETNRKEVERLRETIRTLNDHIDDGTEVYWFDVFDLAAWADATRALLAAVPPSEPREGDPSRSRWCPALAVCPRAAAIVEQIVPADSLARREWTFSPTITSPDHLERVLAVVGAMVALMSTERDFDRPAPPCFYCAKGWRRVSGKHPPTQRHGMIPEAAPCTAIEAVHLGNATDDNTKPWIVFVEGRRLLDKRGFPRRYTTEATAACAGRYALEDFFP